MAVPKRDGRFENRMGLSRHGTVGFEIKNEITTIKIQNIMTKITDKSLHSNPMAFYYSAMQAFDNRMAAVETKLERFLTMGAEQHRLFGRSTRLTRTRRRAN